MRIKIYAVGTKMPLWVEQGCQQYTQRMPKAMALTIHELPLAKRHKNADPDKLKQLEGSQLLAQINSRDLVIAMEVAGNAWSTAQVAEKFGHWRTLGKDIALMIGGPDGLAEQCLQRADIHWSLSPLTLPHTLVRIVLTEQLYRAATILQGHPYHRD